MKETEAYFHLFLTSTQDGDDLITSRPYRSTNQTQKFDSGVGRRAGPDILKGRKVFYPCKKIWSKNTEWNSRNVFYKNILILKYLLYPVGATRATRVIILALLILKISGED